VDLIKASPPSTDFLSQRIPKQHPMTPGELDPARPSGRRGSWFTPVRRRGGWTYRSVWWPRIWTQNTVEPMRTSATGRDTFSALGFGVHGAWPVIIGQDHPEVVCGRVFGMRELRCAGRDHAHQGPSCSASRRSSRRRIERRSRRRWARTARWWSALSVGSRHAPVHAVIPAVFATSAIGDTFLLIDSAACCLAELP